MKHHLSDRQIDKFVSHTLPPSELLQVDDHLAACETCMQKVAGLKDQSGSKLKDQLFARDADDDHLSYDLMSGFVDESINSAERELVQFHRQICGECSADIDQLYDLRTALITESASPSGQTYARTSWIAGLFASPFFRVAVPAAAILLIGLAFWYFPTARPANMVEVKQPMPESTPLIDSNNSLNSIETTTPSAQRIVASLNDAGGRIELDETGKLSGLSDKEFEQKVRAALKNQTMDIPSDLHQLRSANGVMMGNSENGTPFKLLGPIGKVLETQRPAFSWEPLNDAESYKVGIYDENFNQVAVSPSLQTTKWTSNADLKRGRIYQWQVTAIRNGKEIKSPVRPAPEAKFKVVDEASFVALEKARRMEPNSHLVLGIAYANAGLIDEAEREFQTLLKQNPNSDIARKLLAKVRSQR